MRVRIPVMAGLFCAATTLAAQDLRVERLDVAGGAELLTVFGSLQESTPQHDVPLVAVLRDTLGDNNPHNDRLRYVWVLTASRPNLIQRALAALPFYYWRTDFGKNPEKTPSPVLDMSNTRRQVWTGLAGAMTQAMALDPSGMLVRSSTRSYRNHAADNRRMHLLEGVAVLSLLDDQPPIAELFQGTELLEIQARLALASRALGGLVDDSSLRQAYLSDRTRIEQVRGHNWELLRTRAEKNGLWFEPFGLNGNATHAILWIAREELGRPRAFDGRFLGLKDPWRDPRLRSWSGYSEIRDGKEMIPLGLYSLEFPKVPLLMVDFRDTRSPKRREMVRRAATDTVNGVLGITRWGNWPYMAGQWTWNFVRRRHGAPYDRDARLRAYSQLRHWVALEHAMDPTLRDEIQHRLETAGVNPMADSVANDVKLARSQYQSLLRYASDEKGLGARLDRDRREELGRYVHGGKSRAAFRTLHFLSFGLYTHREDETPDFEARLGRERSIARHLRFLETVAVSSPQTEIVWDIDEVRRALDSLVASGFPSRSAGIVARIQSQTHDQETRDLCRRALESLNVAAGSQ